MKTSNREQLFDSLIELHRRYPSWRFGQLVANVSDWANESVWDIEDEKLLATIEKHLQSVTHTQSSTGA